MVSCSKLLQIFNLRTGDWTGGPTSRIESDRKVLLREASENDIQRRELHTEKAPPETLHSSPLGQAYPHSAPVRITVLEESHGLFQQ